ncbi:MAG: TonB-dependent receptor [Alphaproteobacteria bacterium]
MTTEGVRSGMRNMPTTHLKSIILGTSVAAVVSTAGIAPAMAATETITVQARAIEQEIRDIPVAITAVNEQTMDDYGLKNIEDIAAFTPSLEIQRISSGSGSNISIRGISSSAGTIGIESSVAIIVDGVYFPQNRAINEGLFDTSQVAILKGPQALYFGKNATAGVISIQTNDPGDELEILGKIGYEIEAQQLTGEAVLSTPINDKWGIRLAVSGTKMWQGYIRNTAGPTTYTTLDAANGFSATPRANPAPASEWSPEEESFFGRLTIKGTPSDIFTFRLKASIADVKLNNANLTELYDCSALNGTPHVTVGPTAAIVDGMFVPAMQSPTPLPTVECDTDRASGQNPIPPDVAATSVDLDRFGGQLGEEYKSYIITGDFEFDLDKVYIQTILNWHQQRVGWVIDADGGGETQIFASEFSVFNNYSIESRAATKFDGPLNGVLGVYYQQTDRDFRQEVIFAGAENTAVTDPMDQFIAYDKLSGTDGETISVYGELIWDITQELQLTAGTRYIWEKKDSFFTQPYVNPAFLGLFVEGRVLADATSHDDLIPEATLRWQPNDNYTFFVAYKQGFKSGGFDNGSIDSTLNADPIEDITYQPETVEGFEGGMKADLLDNTLNLEIDFYYYKYDDLQLNFFNASTFAYRTLNAGGAKTKGVEFQANWAPQGIEGLILLASLAYNDAKYTTFSAPCYAGQSPEQGCILDPTVVLQNQDLSGVRRNLAPKWSGNVGFNYTRPFGNGLEFGLSGNVKFKSKYLLSAFIPDAIQGGYASIDAAIRIGDAEGTWQFAIIGKNLNDKYVLVGAVDTPSTGGNVAQANAFQADRYGTPLNPRTIEFELSFRF